MKLLSLSPYSFALFLGLSFSLRAEADPDDFVVEGSDPVDVSDFGQAEWEKDDYPERGQLLVDLQSIEGQNMAHWDQWDHTIDAVRWGRYRVLLTYRLERAALGMQVRVSEQRFKDQLRRSPSDDVAHATVGYIYLSEPGSYPMALMTPPVERVGQFEPISLRLIPAPEHETGEGPSSAEDGSITLLAKQATTHSLKMRYEPKETKNCLGFWSEVEDFATWNFDVEAPGKYRVLVTQGCGKGSGGSESAVSLGDSEISFTVEDTGGFQNWKEIEIGELEIVEKGQQTLKIQPKTKAGKAVHDIQKITLIPVG